METGEQQWRVDAAGQGDLATRERRLHRRLRRTLDPAARISVALVATASEDGRRVRRVLALTDDGLVVARLGVVRRPVVLRRHEPGAVGTTHVAPGDSYVDVAGRRWGVSGAWTYQLFRLRQLAGAADGDQPAAPPARRAG
jgi:hypothetical protein